MIAPTRLGDCRVAIVGLGLIGGSMAMTLQGRTAGLIGIDTDMETRELALKWKIVDHVYPDPRDPSVDVNLIILATPVQKIIQYIHQLDRLFGYPAIVLDVGSTKAEIFKAMSTLPDQFDPIGGHPMCGKETSSITSASPDLFIGAKFILTPLPRTSPNAKKIAEELILAIGSLPVWSDPETHDRWAAATSHLPYLIANALAASTPLEAAALVGPGYRSTSRLSVSPPQMMSEIITTNHNHILEAIERFKLQFDVIEKAIATANVDRLQELLIEGCDRQQDLLSAFDQGEKK